MTRRFRAWWWTALTGVLAGGYVVVAVVGQLPEIRWPALAGAVLVVAGLRLASWRRRIALVVVVVGALVPVVTAWWSLIVPVTAAVIIVCGVVAVGSAADRAPRPARVAS
jgi:hypothetical protein